MSNPMPLLIDASVTVRSDTDASEPFRSSEDVAYDLEVTKRGLFVDTSSLSITVTFVPSHAVYLETAGWWELALSSHEWPDLRLANAWASLERESWFREEPLDRFTRATNPTSTTVSSVAKLLRRQHRDERLRRMSPEARATYERIRTLREEIGPLDFDIVKALRELRNDE